MTFLLAHPAHAKLSCEECRRWLYDIKSATPLSRGGRRVPRPAGAPTPCAECPKKSPENERYLQPSAATAATLRLYLRNKASCGRYLTDAEARDPLLAKHLAILDAVFGAYESTRMYTNLAAIGGMIHGGTRGNLQIKAGQ